MRVAVLDLGSTSFRLVVADWEPDTGLVPHVRRRERLNLGLVVGREGRIPEPHATAAVRAVAKLRRRAAVSGAMPVVAVATSALRDARNGEKVVRRIAAAAGVPVRILSGDEEAALTFDALQAGLPLGDRRVLGVDLGGGSLELAVGSVSDLEWTASLPLGASRLAGSFLHHDPPSEVERERLAAHVEAALGLVDLPDPEPTLCVAAGGTVKALARLFLASGRTRRPLNGLHLPSDAVDEMSRRLLSAGPGQRRRMPGMDQHRADMLGAGTLVLASLLRRFGYDGLVVSDWGLREGVILESVDLALRESAAAV